MTDREAWEDDREAAEQEAECRRRHTPAIDGSRPLMILVDGKVLTWEMLRGLIGDPRSLGFEFDIACGLPVKWALELNARLVDRGVAVEVVQ